MKKIVMLFLATVLALCFGACGGGAEPSETFDVDVGEAEQAFCYETRGEPNHQLIPQPRPACTSDCATAVQEWLHDRIMFSCSMKPGGQNHLDWNCSDECGDLLAYLPNETYISNVVDSYCNLGNPGFGECPGSLDERAACIALCAVYLSEGIEVGEQPSFSNSLDYLFCAENCDQTVFTNQ